MKRLVPQTSASVRERRVDRVTRSRVGVSLTFFPSASASSRATALATQLTETLLKKPPFRFLHDVVSEVQRNTGYARHLFDEEEKTSANIKDKAAKVRYLTKIIACVAIDSGVGSSADVLARPLKIVAGLEPERTNAFLQALARCASRGDGEEAARRVNDGETSAAAAPSESEVASREKVAPPPSAPSTSFDPFAGGSDDARARAASTVSSTPAEAKNETTRVAPSRPLSARRPPPKKKEPTTEPPISPVSAAPATRAADEAHTKQKPFETRGAIMGEDDDDSSDDDAIVGDGLDGLDDDAGANPWSAALGASGSPEGAKTGGALVRDMLAAKREGDASLRERAGDAGGADAAGGGGGGGGGGIILGSRRRRKTAAASDARGDDDAVLGTSLGADAFRDETGSEPTVADASIADAGVAKTGGGDPSSDFADLGAARDVVQALVRSTNPLGRAMDALAEDAESMRVELRFWRRERAKHARRVAEERERWREKTNLKTDGAGVGGSSAADDALAQTEADIERVTEKIEAARLDVAANDATIARLLAMVVTPS